MKNSTVLRDSRNPAPRYRLLIVRSADPAFESNDWRTKPQHFAIVSDQGLRRFRGKADAFRFTFNQNAIANQRFDQWAIVIETLN